MPRKSIDAASVTTWRRSGSAQPQYVGIVRAFLRNRKSDELATVLESDLLTYCLKSPSKGMREKVGRALAQFFGFQADSGELTVDPARRLLERLKAHERRVEVLERLTSAGMNSDDAQHARWRDVARVGFATDRARIPPDRFPGSESTIMCDLTNELLSRTCTLEVSELEVFLEKSIP